MSNTHATRRNFLKTVGASSIALVAFGVPTSGRAAAAPVARVAPSPFFRIDHADDVRVRLTNGDRFVLTVTDRDGNELERHERLTVSRLYRIRSDRFTVAPVAAPTA